jgi:hypothetical protein
MAFGWGMISGDWVAYFLVHDDDQFIRAFILAKKDKLHEHNADMT